MGKQRINSAKLFVCASCEWIFKKGDFNPDLGGCPKCGFAYYSAHYVYGNKAYSLVKTQKQWLDKKLFAYEMELLKEIPIVEEKPKYANFRIL